MIASIVYKDTYTVGINGNNKIKVDGHLLALSDIPFVRYRFSEWGEKQFEFVKMNMERFKGPVHMAEVTLGDNTKEILDKMDDFDNLVKFIYVPIDNTDVSVGLKESTIEQLKNLGDAFYDRIMLKDNSSMIYALAADRIKIEVEKAIGGEFKASDIGVCGSPLSFRNSDAEGQACLTALWARKIMAEYASSPDIVIPTASHECMQCCGCIQYLTIESDLPAPLSSKEKSAAKKSSESTGGESKAPKEPKAPKVTVLWDDDL